MKAFALLVLLVGCASGPVGSPDAALDSSTDAAPPSCPIANTDVLAYQDCGGATKDGYRCITTCGRLPDDGGAGTLLTPECTAPIGTSTPVTGLCVASCGECR